MRKNQLLNIKVFLILYLQINFLSCINNHNTTYEKFDGINLEHYAVSCGIIDSFIGQIVILNEIDSLTYLKVILYRANTKLDSGDIINDSVELPSYNLKNKDISVNLLDFSNNRQENISYIYDCADVGNSNIHPDTLQCIGGRIRISVKPNSEKLNYPRMYKIALLNTMFSNSKGIDSLESNWISFEPR